MHKKIQYRYGFAIDAKSVHAEWLFYTPKVRELEVFTRRLQKIDLTHHAKKEKKLIDEKLVRPNALFLSVAAQFNSEIATQVLDWFSNLKSLHADREGAYGIFTRKLAQEKEYQKLILDLLKKADIGIEGFQVDEKEIPFEELPLLIQHDLSQQGRQGGLKSLDVRSTHRKYDKKNKVVGMADFSMDREESSGTQKFFGLTGPIIDTIQNGHVLFVDELDSKLHPALVEELCRLFNSRERNPKNAQLVFVSHNTSVLSKDLFRRDQIWFVEKDRYGASDLFSLVEYRDKNSKIRNDASYEKDYLKGRYGAIPILQHFEVL